MLYFFTLSSLPSQLSLCCSATPFWRRGGCGGADAGAGLPLFPARGPAPAPTRGAAAVPPPVPPALPPRPRPPRRSFIRIFLSSAPSCPSHLRARARCPLLPPNPASARDLWLPGSSRPVSACAPHPQLPSPTSLSS